MPGSPEPRLWCRLAEQEPARLHDLPPDDGIQVGQRGGENVEQRGEGAGVTLGDRAGPVGVGTQQDGRAAEEIPVSPVHVGPSPEARDPPGWSPSPRNAHRCSSAEL